MNYDEQAVVCESLAELLRAGMTLPEALGQVAGMIGNRKLRAKLANIADQVAHGVPLTKAVDDVELTEILKCTLQQGVATGNMSDVVRQHGATCRDLAAIQARLRQVLMFPFWIYLVTLSSAVLVGIGFWFLGPTAVEIITEALEGARLPLLTELLRGPRWLVAPLPVLIWLGPGLIVGFIVWIRPGRKWMRWRLPIWREISLVRMSSSLALVMRLGLRFEEAIGVVRKTEKGSVMEEELSRWQAELAQGQSNFVRLAFPSEVLPVFFMGLVSAGGSDLAAGFRVAAHVYRTIAEDKLNRLESILVPLSLVLAMVYVMGLMAVILFGIIFPILGLFSCGCM